MRTNLGWALLCCLLSLPAQAAEPERDWTFIYVMSYDNNLEGCADIINAGLRKGVQSERIAVSVLEDRRDSEGLKRLVTDGSKHEEERLPTEDITSMEVLRAHLQHASKTLTAKRYALIFLNHGGRLDDMCVDEHVEVAGPRVERWMSAREAGPTVRAWSKTLGAKKLDLLFLQQCGRGSVENLYNFRDCAKAVLSSQLVVGAPNTYYTAVLKKTGEEPDISGVELGKSIMAEDQHYTNYVLVDGGKIGDFPKRARPLVRALVKSKADFTRPSARPCFDVGAEQNFDLLMTLEELTKTHLKANDRRYTKLAKWIEKDLILAFTHRRRGLPWRGLSTFVPRSPAQYRRYAALPIYQESCWSELTERWLGKAKATKRGRF